MNKNKSKKSTLVYNGGSMKFNTTGGDFKNFYVTENTKIGQLLDLFTGDESSVYSLDYEKSLDSYNIKDFFFFYEKVEESTKMDLSYLRVKDDSKRFLIFVDIKDADFTIEGTCSWTGEEPRFLKNNQYLFLVEKLNDLRFNLTLIARSVERNNVLKIKFNIKEENEILDLTETFPEYILGFKPRYNGYISFGDNEELFKFYLKSPGLKHTYKQKGEYVVTITGVCEGLGQVPHNCTECIEIKGVKYFGKCFSYCTNFTSFPDNFFHGIGPQQELNGCFQGTKINRIPENLFIENTTLKKIVSLFSECVGLNDVDTEEGGEVVPKEPIIPENLFKPLKNLEELVSVFDSSYYISKVPKDIFKHNTKLKNINRAFSMIGLDLGDTSIENEQHLTLLDNIPEGIVDGKNIKTTESVFSGLGFGRIIRHLDHKRNPHETTLQQAYDAQEYGINGVSVKADKGITFEKDVKSDFFENLKAINNISSITGMVKMGFLKEKYDFYGFSSGVENDKIHNVVSGAPLRLDFPAEEENQAVTLKQLRQAELNGLEFIGSWNINENTTDYSTLGNGITVDTIPPIENEHLKSEEDKFKVGACYYVRVSNEKSARIQIDGVWWSTGDYLLIIGPKGNGWTSSGSNPNISKIENSPSIKSVFENSNVNESLAYIGDVTKKVVKGEPYAVLLQIPSSSNEDSILKNVNNKGFEIKPDGSIIISGVLKQEETPLNDVDVTNKRYVDKKISDNLIGIKLLDNINEDSTKIDSAWFGMNVFNNQTFFEDYITINAQADFSEKVDFGSKDVGWFRFNFVDDDEKIKRFEFVDSAKEQMYKIDCKNTGIIQSFVVGDSEELLTLDLGSNIFEKIYSNISVKTNKSGIENFDNNEFITKSVVNEAIGDFSKNFVLEKGVSRDVNFSGLPNSAQSNGCRFVVKSANISGLIRVSELKFFTPNDNLGTVADCDLMIGIYKMNSESGVNENNQKYSRWHYPERLVAYSIDKGVRNVRGQEIVFSHLVQAQPRKEGQQRESHVNLTVGPNNLQVDDSGQLVLDENGNPIPVDFEYPHEFIPNSEDEIVHPDDPENPGFYWDASEAMMVVFFKQELNEDQSIKKLPPILGKYITGVEYQSYAPFANGRFESFSTVNYQTEVTSVYTYNDANWAFIPTKPRVIKYNGQNHCLKMVLKAKGVNELHAFGVNTTGNYLTGTSNVWTGTYNDFYGSTLLYKKGETDTEVVTIQLLKENLFPINSVFTTTQENGYPQLPNSTWNLLGTQVIGGSTIYYYKRSN